MKKNYYELIGLEPSASQTEIDDVCITLAKQYHPDKTAGDLNAKIKFKEIEEAYETLGDPEKRAKYNLELKEPQPAKITTAETPSVINCSCPACNSSNVQRLSIIHSSGITEVDLLTKGSSIGIGGGIATGGIKGIGLGLSKNKSKTTGTHQTELSKMAAPPKKIFPEHTKRIEEAAVGAGLLCLVGLFVIYNSLFIALIIASIFGVILWALLVMIFTTKEQKIEAAHKNEIAMIKWQNSFMCLTCGHKYERA